MSHFGVNCGGSLPLTHSVLCFVTVLFPHVVNVTFNPSLITGSQPKFSTSIDQETKVVKVFVPDARSPNGGEELLVCGKTWNMAAANVACKENGTLL